MRSSVTIFALMLIVSSAGAGQDSCWVNERTRMDCFKQAAIKSGKFAIAANPLNAKKNDEDGYTNLHLMATYNAVAEAEALFKAGANINAVSRIHGSPLCLAAKATQVEMVKFLLKNGANPDLTDDSGFTPLIGALWQNLPQGEGIDLVAQDKILDLLISHGADLNLPNQWGNYPLSIAMFKPDYRRKFLAAGASVNLKVKPFADNSKKPKSDYFNTQPALIIASGYVSERSEQEVAEAVSDLLAAGAPVDSRGHSANTPLMNLAANNRVSALELVVKAGAKANSKNAFGQNALMIAVLSASNPRIVEILLPLTDLKSKDMNGRAVKDYLSRKLLPEELKSSRKATNIGYRWRAAEANTSNTDREMNMQAIRAIFDRATQR